jgi:hypothetical protein
MQNIRPKNGFPAEKEKREGDFAGDIWLCNRVYERGVEEYC